MKTKTLMLIFLSTFLLLVPFILAPDATTGGGITSSDGMTADQGQTGDMGITGHSSGAGATTTAATTTTSTSTTSTSTTSTIGPDTTAPTISIVLPSNTSYNVTSMDFNVSLNEMGSWCGYSLDSAANVSMENSSTTAFGKTASSLTAGGRNVKFYCNDSSNNMGSSSVRYFTVDLTAATISGGSPTGTTTDNTPTISVTTNENANCQYKTSSFVYGAGTAFSTTGGTSHSKTLSALSDATHTYYASCNDTAGNLNTTAYSWSFIVDAVQEKTIPSINATAPATMVSVTSNTSITIGGANTTITNAQINTTKYDATPSATTPINGTALKYIQITNSSDINSTYITWFLIEVNYTQSEVTDNNITESTLALYWWNTSVNEWQRMISDWDWVWSTGVDTTRNVVWANTTHFSYYAVNGSDTSAPIISGGSPTGTTTDNTPTISVTTNEDATCRYSTSNVAYASMTAFTTTGGTSHSSTLSTLSDATHTYYARCRDATGNTNTTSYSWSFTVSAAAAGAGGGGGAAATTAATTTTAVTTAATTTTVEGVTTVETTAPTTTTSVPPLPEIIPGLPWWLPYLTALVVLVVGVALIIGYRQGWFKGLNLPKPKAGL